MMAIHLMSLWEAAYYNPKVFISTKIINILEIVKMLVWYDQNQKSDIRPL
jgi:hypothetical protein